MKSTQKNAGTKRPLTEKETEWAASVFGDSIAYRKVRIVTVDDDSFVSRYILRNMPAVVIGNRIYFSINPDGTCCYNPEVPGHANTFIHEMTHVYQYQKTHGWRYAIIALKEHRSLSNPYSFALDPLKKFKDYGIEQQAMIVQTYFAGSFSGEDKQTALMILQEQGLFT